MQKYEIKLNHLLNIITKRRQRNKEKTTVYNDGSLSVYSKSIIRKNLCHLLGLDDVYASLIHRRSKLGKSSPQSLENGKKINRFSQNYSYYDY